MDGIYIEGERGRGLYYSYLVNCEQLPIAGVRDHYLVDGGGSPSFLVISAVKLLIFYP